MNAYELKQMLEICKEGILEDSQLTILGNPVFPQPYIPYIPDNWKNGVLVLAEAQNLAKSNDNYVKILNEMGATKRLERLYHAVKTEKRRVRIQPWDDGSLQLAVEAALDERPSRTAVSNSVLWSLRKMNGTNKTPTMRLVKKSRIIWGKLLDIMKPRMILTAGRIARLVIQPIWAKEKQINLRSSSPIAMAILAGQTDIRLIENERPTIERLREEYPDLFPKNSRFTELYIWHAITTKQQINDK